MTTTFPVVEDTDGWAVGVCAQVDMAGRPTPTPCDGTQYATVIAITDTASACPDDSDWTLPAGESVACFANEQPSS